MRKIKLNKLTKACLLGAAAIASSSTALANEQFEGVQQPNFLMIMVDDMGSWALGVHNPLIETPNLDYLAETGIRFDNGYTPAPVSSAARASFFTGKMPSQHGIYDFIAENPKYNNDFLEGEELLQEKLKDYGYRTALIGKWHIDYESTNPKTGFDKWLSYDSLNSPPLEKYRHTGTVSFSRDGKPFKQTGIQAQFLTKETIDFIDQDGDKPFFISLNYIEPHAPLIGLPERLVKKYRPVARKIIAAGGNSALDAMQAVNETPADHEEQLSQHLAAVTLLDEQVGTILNELEGRGLLENTIISFVGDNGLMVGQYGLYGKVNASFPYNYYDETVRVPFIVSAPKSMMWQGQVRNEFVDNIDLHATIIDYASGGKDSADYGPGKSMRALFEGGRPRDWKEFQISERGNSRMITNGHWKLVRYYTDAKGTIMDHWYDLSSPMKETILSTPPGKELKERMISELDEFFSVYTDSRFDGKKMWEMKNINFMTQKIKDDPRWD